MSRHAWHRSRCVRAIGAAIGLFAIACLVGCGGSGGSTIAGQSSSGSLGPTPAIHDTTPVASVTWALNATSRQLDNFATNITPATFYVLPNVLNGLLQFSPSGALEPALASSWRRVDPVTYVYHLRNDARFADGKLVTAADVVYSYQRSSNPATGGANASFYPSFKAATAPDPHTVVVKLTRPDNFWKYIPAHRAGWVVEKAFAERHPHDLGAPDVGTMGAGPYKIAAFVPDDHVTLVRNPQYYGPPAPVKQLTIKFIPDDTTRLNAIRSGDVDGTFDVPVLNLPAWRGSTNTRMYSAPSTNSDDFVFNVAVKPFDDVHVRRAFVYALPRQQIVDRLFHGQARVSDAYGQPELWLGYGLSTKQAEANYERELPHYPFDMKKAAQEVKQSRYPDGFNLTVDTDASYPYLSRVLEILQPNLAKLGIHIKIHEVPEGKWIAGILARKVPFYASPDAGDFPDAMNNPYLHYHSRYANSSGYNFSNYRNATMDRLLDAQLADTSNAKRVDDAMAALRLAQEELPLENLWWTNGLLVLNKRLAFSGFGGTWTQSRPWGADIRAASGS